MTSTDHNQLLSHTKGSSDCSWCDMTGTYTLTEQSLTASSALIIISYLPARINHRICFWRDLTFALPRVTVSRTASSVLIVISYLLTRGDNDVCCSLDLTCSDSQSEESRTASVALDLLLSLPTARQHLASVMYHLSEQMRGVSSQQGDGLLEAEGRECRFDVPPSDAAVIFGRLLAEVRLIFHVSSP